VWKAVGVVLLLCGALITAWTPDSALGQAAYLTCFAGMSAAAWTAALRSSARGRRTPWVLVSAAVSSWLAGDVTWGILHLTHAETDVGLPDLFWLAGYPLLAAAMLSIVRRRGPGRGRAALQDGLTLTTAASVAAWQLFIAPGLDGGGSALTVFVGALYPVGDLVLLAAVLYLVLSPGRTGLPGKLLVAGTALMMLLDTGFTVVGANWAADVDRLNGALLLANGLVVAPLLLRDRDLLVRPVRAEVASLHPARQIFLGLALLTAPVLAVAQGAAPARERVLLLLATVTTVALCVARFTGAVREQARAQQRLIHLAGHDSLTGLANRRALSERLAEDFDGMALLYIDLDGFKAVNDEHGHAAGDAVLVEVARRVRGQARSSDLSARLGGDEFAVLCAGMSAAHASELATRLEFALREPILADGAVVRVGASVGIALAAECIDGGDLLSRADQAMFAVKRARRAEKTYSRI
jgi:diguanylate cyclase (GGDEF)-like protein